MTTDRHDDRTTTNDVERIEIPGAGHPEQPADGPADWHNDFMHSLKLKKFSSTVTNDGECVFCELWIDNSLAAHISDDGMGGEIRWDWVDEFGEFVPANWNRNRDTDVEDEATKGGFRGRRCTDWDVPFDLDSHAGRNRRIWCEWKRHVVCLTGDTEYGDDDCAFDLWYPVGKSRGRRTFAILSDSTTMVANGKPSPATIAALKKLDKRALILA